MDKLSIQELKNGSQAAFKLLVEKNKNQVINTCFGFVNNYSIAEDLAQDVFVEVYESINQFNEDSKLSTWIYRIAVNKSLDHLRKAKRKKRWAELTRINMDEKEDTDNYYTDSVTPENTLENNERIKILNTAVNSLPENQKTAFTLHKYEELSYKDISEIMNTSISSIESLMFRAKKNLQKKLTNYYLLDKN